jgi:hypothetical protein
MMEAHREDAEEAATKERTAFHGLESCRFAPKQSFESVHGLQCTVFLSVQAPQSAQEQAGWQFQVSFRHFEFKEHDMFGGGMERIEPAGKFVL